MIAPFLALLTIPACVSTASRQNQPNRDAAQRSAEDQQSSADPSAAALQKQPDTKSADTPTSNKTGRDGNKLATLGAVEWSAIFQAASALIVAIFTGFLVWYSHRGWTVAKKAADAATASAEAAKTALTVTHRPQFVVGPIETDGFNGRHILKHLRNGRTWITNIGVLPGTVQKFWAGWYFWDVLPMDNPAHRSVEGDTLTEFLPGHFAKVSLPDFEVPTEASITINNIADAAEQGLRSAGSTLNMPKGSLYLVGCLKYRDSIGLRRMYFAYRYDPFSGLFEAVDHPNYKYEK